MTIQIYGKADCPYTRAARQALEGRGAAVEYFDVLEDPEAMRKLLALSKGQRRVPVIVEDGRVTIGYGGS